jgi:hypothetical protein
MRACRKGGTCPDSEHAEQTIKTRSSAINKSGLFYLIRTILSGYVLKPVRRGVFSSFC